MPFFVSMEQSESVAVPMRKTEAHMHSCQIKLLRAKQFKKLVEIPFVYMKYWWIQGLGKSLALISSMQGTKIALVICLRTNYLFWERNPCNVIYNCKLLKARLTWSWIFLSFSLNSIYHVVPVSYFIFAFIYRIALAITIISLLTFSQCIHPVSKGTLSFVAL